MNLKNPIKFTNIFFQILVKVLKIKVKITGEENIPKDKSILFCANHFTRFETLFLPYLFSSIEHLKYARSLAYKDLFFGKVGEYLKGVKAVSTGDSGRDKIIINDLISGEYNWIIYPEGQMMKDKKIFTTKPSIFKKYKMLKFSAKTGVATLAMRAELEALEKGNIYICPITVSYRPMHAKRNNLYLLIKRFIDKPNISKKIKNEIFFESSILSYSKILLHFHKPISVKDYMDDAVLIPQNLKIEYLRYSLTNDIMHIIYKGTPLTFDHFFSFCIFCLTENKVLRIEIKKLKEILFNLIATALTTREDLVFSYSVDEFNSLKLMIKDEKHEMLEIAIHEMESKGLGFAKDGIFYIVEEELLKEREFIEIRIKNIFQVFLNEISYFKSLCVNLKQTFLKDDESLIKENGMLMFKLLEQDYLKERECKRDDMKPLEVGLPKLNIISDVGVLLCHGFKSSPREMDKIAEFLNNSNVSTYSLRLKGHGTSPEEMKKQTGQEWILSHYFASEAMLRVCKKVFVCGFSMGGLLSLINATRFNYQGLISVSAPLKITDYKFYLAGVANELTSAFKMFNKNAKDFILIEPEHPQINYKKTYFSSLKELNAIIKLAKERLSLVQIPSLIIQGTKDDIVSSDSRNIIFNEIKSANKELFDYNNSKGHVIVLEENNTELLSKILNFVQNHL